MHRRDYRAQMGILMITQLHDLRKAGRQNKPGTFGKALASWVVRLAVTVLCLSLGSISCSHHISNMAWAC